MSFDQDMRQRFPSDAKMPTGVFKWADESSVVEVLRKRIADLENENRRLRAELADGASAQVIESICCGEKLTCPKCNRTQPCLCGNGIE